MANHYFLHEDHSYTPCDLMTWAAQLEVLVNAGKKHVAYDIVDGFRISTVWLGLNHNFLDIGRPLLFETMIFDDEGACGWDYHYQERYTTWDEAVKGHQEAIEWLKAQINTKP